MRKTRLVITISFVIGVLTLSNNNILAETTVVGDATLSHERTPVEAVLDAATKAKSEAEATRRMLDLLSIIKYEMPFVMPSETIDLGYGRVDYLDAISEGGMFNYPVFWVDVLDQGVHWANRTATVCSDGDNRADCAADNTVIFTGSTTIGQCLPHYINF